MRLLRGTDGSRTHGTLNAKGGLARSQPAGQPDGGGTLSGPAQPMTLVVLFGDDTRAGYSEQGVNIVHGPARSTTDTRGQMAPKTPPLHPSEPSSARDCPSWALFGRVVGRAQKAQVNCSPAERSLKFQSAIPRRAEVQETCLARRGPPLGVSPPCGSMLRHNKVGQTP